MSISKYFSAFDFTIFDNILDNIAFGCNALIDSNNDMVSAKQIDPAAILTAVNSSYVINMNLSNKSAPQINNAASVNLFTVFQNLFDSNWTLPNFLETLYP